LQSSLLASRNGVLALDLAAIGQGTREQVELSLQLGKNIGVAATSAARIGRLMGARRACGWPRSRRNSTRTRTRTQSRPQARRTRSLASLTVAIRIIGAGAGEAARACEYAGGPSVNYGPPWAFQWRGGRGPLISRAGRSERCPSLNASLASALSGLIAEQGALAVTTNNVANVNTPGYSREEPVLTRAIRWWSIPSPSAPE